MGRDVREAVEQLVASRALALAAERGWRRPRRAGGRLRPEESAAGRVALSRGGAPVYEDDDADRALGLLADEATTSGVTPQTAVTVARRSRPGQQATNGDRRRFSAAARYSRP